MDSLGLRSRVTAKLVANCLLTTGDRLRPITRFLPLTAQLLLPKLHKYKLQSLLRSQYTGPMSVPGQCALSIIGRKSDAGLTFRINSTPGSSPWLICRFD